MKRVRLSIEYKGTAYVGWQSQRNGRSIQGEIEEALLELLKKEIKINGAGRTDAGVHALFQIAHFDIDNELIDINKMSSALNYILRKKKNEITIIDSRYVAKNFHSRFSVKKKKYLYKIINRPTYSYLLKNKAWFIPNKLNTKMMLDASKYLIGKFDFSAFRSSSCQAINSVRSIENISLKKNKHIISINVTGKSFLHNQVRIIVGTLVNVGKEKISSSEVKKILDSKDRTKAGPTAPAHGLYLERIFY